MALMNRVRVGWSGWIGQPGLTTFYLSDARLDVTPIKTFFTAMATYVPSPISWLIPALGDKIDDHTGALSGAWVGTGGGTIAAGASGGSFSGTSGFLIDWKTSTINHGHRIQGRSFMVPAAANVYESNGTIVEATRTAIAVAATTLITAMSPDLLIWSRPFPGRAASAGPPPVTALPPREGMSGPIVAATVPDIAVVMRSRRS